MHFGCRTCHYFSLKLSNGKRHNFLTHHLLEPFFFPHPVKIVLRFILIVYSLGPLTCFLGRLRHCLTSLKFSSSEVKKITEFEH